MRETGRRAADSDQQFGDRTGRPGRQTNRIGRQCGNVSNPHRRTAGGCQYLLPCESACDKGDLTESWYAPKVRTESSVLIRSQ